MKVIIASALLAAAATSAHAVVQTSDLGYATSYLGTSPSYLGTSPSRLAPNANTDDIDAAFQNWSNAIFDFDTDGMNGPDRASGADPITTDAGSSFKELEPNGTFLVFAALSRTQAPSFFPGDVLTLGNPTTDPSKFQGFTWTLPTPSDAFSFFALDVDGAGVQVEFDDGIARRTSVFSDLGDTGVVTADNPVSLRYMFIGFSGLANPVSEVTILTNDRGTGGDDRSIYDNFSYGTTTAPPPVVPLPAGLPLLAAGLAALGLAARRRP